METKPIWLAGYDHHGKVYIVGNHIEREIKQPYINYVLHIFNIYKLNNLEASGIVRTDINAEYNKLIHRRHFISYPFEWTANMYKDAVLFHLNLFLQLEQHGLTLKDALPNNIVFDFCKPIFVDFLSIVPQKDLKSESWLMTGKNYAEPRYAVFDVMFEPFILISFMAMAEKKYGLSRRMLAEKSCNTDGRVPRWKDVYPGSVLKYGWWGKVLIKHLIKKLLGISSELPVYPQKPSNLFRLLSSKEGLTFTDFTSQLMQFVESVDVTPPQSAYFSYYDAKNEKFDFSDQTLWLAKQKAVAKIMDSEKPSTMLDIGANTGWFSILAAQRGIKVIATDVDESSIDALYLYSKQKKLKILPLLISFDNMTRQIFGKTYSDLEYRDRNFKATPLYVPATDRLKSDMVLCLGLLHHLVLGIGMQLSEVFGILSKLVRKTLILEFIELQDKLIQEEPSFFTHIGKYSSEKYNIETVIEETKRYFNSYDIVDSHPKTRKFLICRK
jgi:SAM-dependent methyltransferase